MTSLDQARRRRIRHWVLAYDAGKVSRTQAQEAISAISARLGHPPIALPAGDSRPALALVRGIGH